MKDGAPEPSGEQTPGRAQEVRAIFARLNAAALLRSVVSAQEQASRHPGAGAWEPPTPEDLSVVLPGYEVHALIGRGGMGAVYRATHHELGRTVALKVLPAGGEGQEEMVERFRREAWTLGQFSHPNIVHIHDTGTSLAGHPFLEMEHVDGPDLARRLAQLQAEGERLPVGETLRIMRQMCAAVEAAHAAGVVHRDLKPGNVLLAADGAVKLVDFGLARPLARSALAAMTGAGQLLGTFGYMAPEQRRQGEPGGEDGPPPDHRVDVYALGVILYEMLCGEPPLGGFLPPSVKAGVDPRFDAIVARAIHASPDCRYSTVAEMDAALAALSRPQPWWVRARRPLTAAALLVLTVVGAALLWKGGVLWRRPSERMVAEVGALERVAGLDRLFVAPRPVTRAQFARFVAATGYEPTTCRPAERDRDCESPVLRWDSPGVPQTADSAVLCVGWHDAEIYCRWLTDLALQRGEISPGEHFRLPAIDEWQLFRDVEVPEGLQEWTADASAFHRPWHQAMPSPRGRVRDGDGPRGGFEDRGGGKLTFRVVLDSPQGPAREAAQRVAAAVRRIEGKERALKNCGSWLISDRTVRVDLSRVGHVPDLAPLAGTGLRELVMVTDVAPDLTPLRAEPLERLMVAGPVQNLAPVATLTLRELSLDGMDRWPAPPLAPLVGTKLRSLALRRHPGPPDVPIASIPTVKEFICLGCRVKDLAFLEGTALEEVDIDRVDVTDPAALAVLRNARSVQWWPGLLEPAFVKMDEGDFDGALELVNRLAAGVAEFDWSRSWKKEIDARGELARLGRDRNLGPWVRAGCQGAPPWATEWQGHRYMLIRLQLARAEAEGLAQRWGGHLVTVSSADENGFLAELSNKGPRFWLGGNRPQPASAWFWHTGEPFAWSPPDWSPDGASGPLVMASPHLSWKIASPAEKKAHTVIEWPAEGEMLRSHAVAARVSGTWVMPPDGVPVTFLPRGRLAGVSGFSGWWSVCDAGRSRIRVCQDYGRMMHVIEVRDDGTMHCLTPDGRAFDLTRVP